MSEQQPDAGPPGPTGPSVPSSPNQEDVRTARVRRAPRYQVFIGTGAVLGLLVALVTGLTGPVQAQSSRAQLLGYLAIGFGLLGALLGGVVAVLVERFGPRSRIDHP